MKKTNEKSSNPLKILKFPSALLLAFISTSIAWGAEIGCPDETIKLNIAEQNMDQAINTLALRSGFRVVFYSDVAKNLKAKPLAGEYDSCEAAISTLLSGSNLTYSVISDKTIAIHEAGYLSRRAGQKEILLAANGNLSLGIRDNAINDEVDNGGEDAFGGFVIEEIVVTAQKREQNIQDVPISILALSGEDLVAQGISDLQTLSLAVPGLLVAETGSWQRRISIRGIGNTFGSSSLVGLYVDETSVAGLPSNQVDLRIHDLERIEVLKGPQGTLYGEGSVGGTIRYITNDPQLDGFSGEATVDGSTTKDGDPSQEVKGVINIPLVDDSLGLRVVGQYINSGGWIDQPALSKSDINDYELFNVRAKLLWLPSDELEIKTSAIIHRNDIGAQNIGEDDAGNYTQAFGDLSTPSGSDDYDLYNLLVNYDLGSMSLISSTSYFDADKKVNNLGNQCCFPTGTPGEFWNLLIESFDVSAEIFTQELRLSTNESGPWYWSAGLFYKDAQLVPQDSQSFTAGVPGGTPGVNLFDFGDSFSEEESQSWAFFLETSYAITERLEAGVGLRYFEDDRRFRAGGTGDFQKETFDSANPKVFFKYDLTDEVNIYANAAKGFRSGGFNGAGQPPFDPESVWSYELGSKMSLLENRLRTDVALFYTEYDDYQVVGVIPTLGLNITSNGGAAEILGVEWSVLWLASEQLELGFNGNYMDTEFVEINVTSSSYAEGDPLDLVPQYGFSVWGNYSFNWFDGSPGFFRLDYNEQGKSNFRNRSFGPDYRSQSDVIEMLNARTGWQRNDWSIEIYALNLLDEDGFVDPFSIDLIASRPRPRTMGINVGFAF